MKTYKVTVTTEVKEFHYFEVPAESREQAEAEALELAPQMDPGHEEVVDRFVYFREDEV